MRSALTALSVIFLAAAAQAAGGGGEGAEHDTTEFWFELGNLVLLLAVLVYFARGPAIEYFTNRRSETVANIERSEKLLSDAQARLDEWEAKANGLEAEVAEIKRATQAAAEGQRDEIIAAAEVSADRIRKSARALAEREMLTARERLREEAADMAADMAAKMLSENVNDGDRSRLVDEFISELESGGNA